MHILVFEEEPTLYGGGQERSLFEVITELSKKKYLFSITYTKKGDLLAYYKDICVGIIQTKHRRFNTKTLHLMLIDLLKLYVYILFAKKKVELIYVNQYFDLPLAALLSIFTNIPVVCHLRIVAPPYMSRQYRWALNKCTNIIANSNYTATSYAEKKICRDKIKVIYNGIDTNYYKSNHKKINENPVILYLGRLNPEKGIEILIEAFQKVILEVPNARLKIIGSIRGDKSIPVNYENDLKKYAEKFCPGKVEFLPHTQDIRNELINADILVLPSIYEEPFGRVLIEAMSCSVPVIASRVGGIPEVLSPDFDKFLVPSCNPSELAHCINIWLLWKKHTPELGNKCREWVIKKFDIDRKIDQISDLFESIVNKNKLIQNNIIE